MGFIWDEQISHHKNPYEPISIYIQWNVMSREVGARFFGYPQLKWRLEVQVLNLAKVGKVKLGVKLVPGLFEDGDENLTLFKVQKVTT